MLRKLVTVLMAVLTCAGIGLLGTVSTASASIPACGDGPYPTYTNQPMGCPIADDTGSFIKNDDTRQHYAWCKDFQYATKSYVYIDRLTVGENSERNCLDFDVLNRERVLYKSLSSGILYWSNCGQNLPYFSPRPPNGGFWQQVGNSVQLQKHVSYPTAPANVC